MSNDDRMIDWFGTTPEPTALARQQGMQISPELVLVPARVHVAKAQLEFGSKVRATYAGVARTAIIATAFVIVGLHNPWLARMAGGDPKKPDAWATEQRDDQAREDTSEPADRRPTPRVASGLVPGEKLIVISAGREYWLDNLIRREGRVICGCALDGDALNLMRDSVLARNPHIIDPDLLAIGDEVVFPAKHRLCTGSRTRARR